MQERHLKFRKGTLHAMKQQWELLLPTLFNFRPLESFETWRITVALAS